MLVLINGAVVLSVAFLNIFLGWAVLTHNRKRLVNQIFWAICIWFAIWSLSLFFYEHTFFATSLFWIQLTYLMAVLYMITTLIFSFYFPNPAFNKAWIWAKIYLVFYFFFSVYLLFFTKFWVIGVVRDPIKGLQTILGTEGYSIWIIATWVIFLWITVNFIIKSRHSSGLQKVQLRYLWLGYILFGVAVTISDGIIPLVFHDTRYFHISVTCNLFFSGLVSYIILKHRFLDIRIVFKESIVAILTMLFFWLIMSIGALVYWIITQQTPRYSVFIILFFFALMVILTYQPLLKLSNAIAHRYLFQSIYDFQKTLIDLGNKMTTIIEIDVLAEEVSKTLTEAFKVDKLLLITYNNNMKQFKLEKTIGFDIMQEEFFNSFEQVKAVLPNIKQTVVFDEINSLITDSTNETQIAWLKHLSKTMEELNIALISPVINAGDLIAVIVLGDKRSNDPYTVQDINFIRTLTSQASIAFENALLYKQLFKLNANLEVKVRAETEELKKKNLALQEANQQLKSLDVMKDQLVAITSHELKTPIAIAQDYVWMVLNKPNEGTHLVEADKARLERSLLDIKKLVGLINNILNTSKIEAGKLELNIQGIELDKVLDIVSKSVDEFKDTLKQKQLQLDFIAPHQSDVKVKIDQVRFEEIIVNLISNAIKYTNQGKITLTVQIEEDKVVFHITDTGQGIAPEHLPHLFEKFYREDTALTASNPMTGGTGLGLYITKSLIELMGGKIRVESEVGKGSKFSFFVRRA